MSADFFTVSRDHSLRTSNTFGVEASAARFVELLDARSVQQALDACGPGLPELVLGGGSNLLLTRNLGGAVLRVATQGVRTLSDDPGGVVIEVAAGMNWHELVLSSLSQGLFGLENLALIPGTVGAGPIQNIGAYGCELEEQFAGLTACNMNNGRLHDFSASDCRLAYRNSVFKREDHQHWLILQVRLRLSRVSQPCLRYGELRHELERAGLNNPGALDVARAVMDIRRRKLPDPARIGNAGSFFKNPILPAATALALLADHPGLPVYPVQPGETDQQSDEDSRKISAAWLIDACGWRGHREGDAGVYAGHALILVNHGRASGRELLDLAARIQDSVAQRFGVQLEIEPRVI